MSSWDFGRVLSEIAHKYRELTVGTGRGWGGDNERYHIAYMEYLDDNGDLVMMHFTAPQLKKLIELLIIAYNNGLQLEKEWEKEWEEYSEHEEKIGG